MRKLTIHYLNMHMDDSVSDADMSADWGINSSKISFEKTFSCHFMCFGLVWFICANCMMCNESEDV